MVLGIKSLMPRANGFIWKRAELPHGSLMLARIPNFELRSALELFVALSDSLNIKPQKLFGSD